MLDGANAAFASPIVGAAIQPLLDRPPSETLLAGISLPRVDHRYDPIRNVTDALLASTRHLPHRRVSRIDTCAAHNVHAHAAVVQRGHGLTLVISHLYTRQRFHGFVKKLLLYCHYHEIARIVVVWHFVRLTPPTMGKSVSMPLCVHFDPQCRHLMRKRIYLACPDRLVTVFVVLFSTFVLRRSLRLRRQCDGSFFSTKRG